MHWKPAINFLLSKNQKLPKSLFHGWPFSYCQNSKKFISRLHCQIKIPFLLHMIASTFPHHSLTNAIFLSCCCTVLGAKRWISQTCSDPFSIVLTLLLQWFFLRLIHTLTATYLPNFIAKEEKNLKKVGLCGWTIGKYRKSYSTFHKKTLLNVVCLLFVWLSITGPSAFQWASRGNKQKN